MKEFAIYTGLRILLFVASLVTISLIWSLLNDGKISPIWTLVLAFAVSGVLSYFLLNRQRVAFARRVEERASRAAAAFDERKAREDDEG